MSPASKSKPKDKRAVKEPTKSPSKPPVHVNASSGITASGYNPLFGTFHTFETAPLASAITLNVNGRFRNIDDIDDHSTSLNGIGIEYDSVSNTGSWSGESEDHKERTSQPLRQESVPGADNDRREKIRQKNERKHQRQKEKRAQELHERCSGYLMSMKLESLAQQLVAMGFPQERSTMALILNEGRIEESVAWLFEVGEDDKRVEHNLNGGGNLKIDISEELSRITDMEIRYKLSKQEVERAIVACEGDLDKAEESLKAQKHEPPSPEETGDPPTNAKIQKAASQNTARVQIQGRFSSPAILQQQRDENDFNYAKSPATALGHSMDPMTKNVQSLKKIPPKTEWSKPQQITPSAEKRWPNTGPNPSVSYSLASSLQVSPPLSKTEARYLAIGNELKNLQLGTVREPVAMQRPQRSPPSSRISLSPPGTAMGWYPSNIDSMKPNGLVPPVTASGSLSPNGFSSNPLYNQLHYQPQQKCMPNSSSIDSQATSRTNGSWNRGVPPLSPASSLGLFSRLGINGSSMSSSPVDWSTGSSMLQFDYTNVDWSLDQGLLSSSRSNGWSIRANYGLQQNNTRRYDSFSCNVGAKRPSIAGMQDGVGSIESGGGGGSCEWTSAFEEKDLFSLSRQFVPSASL